MTDVIAGYVIGELLGSGARSSIYMATELATGKTFALKRVVRREPRDRRYFEQVYNEYRVSSQTDHPCLRRCFRLRKVRRMMRVREVLLLMEYVRGQTIEQRRPDELTRTVAIFLSVARGLESLHQLGYVHADIKPNNILVGSDGTVKIIDFGQSCPMGFVKPRIQGTPDYIAPEQVRRLPLDQRTDVFNFGATLYWVLTDRAYPTLLPRKRRNGIELVWQRSAPSPAEVDSRIPPALSRLVMDCCQSNPQDRPADIRQVIARLEVVQHVLGRAGQKRAADASSQQWGRASPGRVGPSSSAAR